MSTEGDDDPGLLSGYRSNHQDFDEGDSSYQPRMDAIDRDTAQGEAGRIEATLPNA